MKFVAVPSYCNQISFSRCKKTFFAAFEQGSKTRAFDSIAFATASQNIMASMRFLSLSLFRSLSLSFFIYICTLSLSLSHIYIRTHFLSHSSINPFLLHPNPNSFFFTLVHQSNSHGKDNFFALEKRKETKNRGFFFLSYFLQKLQQN